MSFTIHGIQHLGVGVPNHEVSWRWYRKFFGMNIPLFNDEAIFAIKREMNRNPKLKVTIPFIANEENIKNIIS